MNQKQIVDNVYDEILSTLESIKNIIDVEEMYSCEIIEYALTNCALSIFTVFEDYTSKMFKHYVELCNEKGVLYTDYQISQIYDMKYSQTLINKKVMTELFQSIENGVKLRDNELSAYFKFNHFNEKNFNSIDEKFKTVFQVTDKTYIGSINIVESTSSLGELLLEGETTINATKIIISFSTKYRHNIAHNSHNHKITAAEIDHLTKQVYYFREVIEHLDSDFEKIYGVRVQYEPNELKNL